MELATKVIEDRQIDKSEDIHLQAWLNVVAKSTTGGKHPKYRYDKFDKFFSRERLKNGEGQQKRLRLESKKEYLKKKNARLLNRRKGDQDNG